MTKKALSEIEGQVATVPAGLVTQAELDEAIVAIPTGVTVPCEAALTTVVTHGLNTRNVSVVVRRATSPWDSVIVEDYSTTLDTVTVPFDVTPSAGQYLISVAPAEGGGATGPTGPAGPAGGAPPVDTQSFATPGSFTWTKPTPPVGSAAYTRVMVIALAPGGGGGSGRKGAAGTARSGGSGGGGSGVTTAWLPYSLLASTESVVVGTPGVGGAAVTTNDTNGSPGTGSTVTGFALSQGYGVRMPGGPGGLGGTNASTAGGGQGGGEELGGPGSATSITGTPANISTPRGAAGGGAGGSISAADVVLASGSGNGLSGGGLSVGGRAGAPGSSVPGTNGTGAAYSSTIGENSGAAGSSGGVGSVTGNAGSGGTGNAYGAGGGGGGAALNGVGNSGAGGDGGPGYVYVLTM